MENEQRHPPPARLRAECLTAHVNPSGSRGFMRVRIPPWARFAIRGNGQCGR